MQQLVRQIRQGASILTLPSSLLALPLGLYLSTCIASTKQVCQD